jgi:hypothetical protein
MVRFLSFIEHDPGADMLSYTGEMRRCKTYSKTFVTTSGKSCKRTKVVVGWRTRRKV